MIVDLNKKNILIIMPFYFQYEQVIRNEIQQRGGNVFFINEDFDEDNFFIRVIRVYFLSVMGYIANSYYKKHFEELPDNIDYVLIIKGRTLTDKVLGLLSRKYEKAKFIMYQWDSVQRAQCALTVAKYCQKKMTFDPVDAENYGWGYRPLFFDEKKCVPKPEKKHKLTFICSLHSQRAMVHKKVKKLAQQLNLNYFFHIYCNKWSYMRQHFLKSAQSYDLDKEDVSFKKISLEKLNEIYDESFCIVDYKFPEQKGLTMRSIESVGHKCKLLTNNESIKKEPFYNANNVFVYRLEDFSIPQEFLSTPYQGVPAPIYHKYTIAGWVDDVFSD